MLQIAGIIDLENLYPQANPSWHTQFTKFFYWQVKGSGFDNKEKKKYKTCCKNLCDHIINLAKIIIITISNNGNAIMHTAYKLYLIMVNKANQVTKPDIWNIFRNHNPAALFMIGNKKQLSPIIISKRKQNLFVNMLHLFLPANSLFWITFVSCLTCNIAWWILLNRWFQNCFTQKRLKIIKTRW